MPDNQTNDDNINKRPKRRAAQRTYVSYENTSVWNEDKDLKRALLASLQDVKKSVSKSTYEQNDKNESNGEKKNNKSDVFSKLNADNSSQSNCKDSQSLVVENSLLSLAAHRRARVSAQRKFASGFTTNSPVSTPIKTGFVASTNVVDLFPNQKPRTEDFLTFLCLRRSPILPPNLDFIRLENEKKVIEGKKRETDSENISNHELETNDKYTTCRLRASLDRRPSSSSTVSKSASLGSRTSLQISNRKKSENQRNDNKIQNLKRHQFLVSESVKNLGQDLNQNVRQSQQNSKTNSQESEESKIKSFDSLKQKYKQQRIDKKSSNPSKILNSNKKNDTKVIKVTHFNDTNETIGIQTRQQLRNHSKNGNEFDSRDKSLSKDGDSGPSERVLRSNKSIIFSHNTSDSSIQKITKSSPQKTNSKKNKSLNSSQIGIRLKKRKARPVIPLIDYYFDSEFDSDSEKKSTYRDTNSLTNSQELKTKSCRNNLKDVKIKKISKPISEEVRTVSHPKGIKKSTNKRKTSLSLEPRRLTRSSRPVSPPKDDKDLERERLIKQRIIEIERKHKRLRRCPSNQSLHSSTSSSSSSSESLPNSLSSSSSINNTRLTRSLEHLKKIRDIAAKLKKEQNKKEDKNKNTVNNRINNRKIKQNVNKMQNSMETQTNESLVNNTKTKNTIKKSTERTVTRSMRDSIVSAMSDTDCDTEGNECQDCEQLISGLSATEDSMADEDDMEDDMERASIVIQDMAEDINSLLVNNSENDLQYGSTEHIQGLMTCEFSGAFSEETVATASAILLPTDCQSEYSYVQTDDSQIRSTVDASTNTTEDDILSCLSSDETNTDSQYEYSSKTLSVGTQTTVNSSVQTDEPLDC